MLSYYRRKVEQKEVLMSNNSLTKSQIDKIFELHYKGYATYEIAQELQISEYLVVKTLGKRY